MVKFVTANTLFKYTWEQVAFAFWQRYPNPNSAHVLTEDVLSRSVENGKLFSCRVLTKTNKIPKWGERFVGKVNTLMIIEESIVDPQEKTITTYTRNIGLQKIMSIEEKCVYKASPDNSMWTLCEKSAWLASSLFGVNRPIEMFGVKQFQRNAQKASVGFDYILTTLFKPEVLNEHPLTVADKIRDTARRAAQIAKSKAPLLSGTSAS